MPWLVAGMLVIAGLTYIAYLGINRNNPPEVARMPNAGNAAPGAQSGENSAGEAAPAGTPPDIASMSPAERFNRLFDRVMRAASAGDTAQAKQFAPMAILAYGMLDTVTADLRYHAAVLYAETGQYAAALALADTILAQNPNHLFGYLVRGEVADRRGMPLPPPRPGRISPRTIRQKSVARTGRSIRITSRSSTSMETA